MGYASSLKPKPLQLGSTRDVIWFRGVVNCRDSVWMVPEGSTCSACEVMKGCEEICDHVKYDTFLVVDREDLVASGGCMSRSVRECVVECVPCVCCKSSSRSWMTEVSLSLNSTRGD